GGVKLTRPTRGGVRAVGRGLLARGTPYRLAGPPARARPQGRPRGRPSPPARQRGEGRPGRGGSDDAPPEVRRGPAPASNARPPAGACPAAGGRLAGPRLRAVGVPLPAGHRGSAMVPGGV